MPTEEERAANNATADRLSTPEARAEVMKRASEAAKEELAKMVGGGLVDGEGDLTDKGRRRVDAAIAASKGTASSSFTGF